VQTAEIKPSRLLACELSLCAGDRDLRRFLDLGLAVRASRQSYQSASSQNSEPLPKEVSCRAYHTCAAAAIKLAKARAARLMPEYAHCLHLG